MPMTGIITTPRLNDDYAGIAWVFHFDHEFELDFELDEVSDHYPVFPELKLIFGD